MVQFNMFGFFVGGGFVKGLWEAVVIVVFVGYNSGISILSLSVPCSMYIFVVRGGAFILYREF